MRGPNDDDDTATVNDSTTACTNAYTEHAYMFAQQITIVN